MTRAPDGVDPKMEDEQVLIGTLRSIAQGDCWSEEGESCSCPVCCATWALNQHMTWRFRAALSERVTDNLHPREARIVEAFMKQMKFDPDGPDRYLATVLKVDVDDVTRRDWYVATSVVQWLSTNIGMCVLEQAGYRYDPKLYEKDNQAIKDKLPTSLLQVGCDSCEDCDGKGMTFCGFCGIRIETWRAANP